MVIANQKDGFVHCNGDYKLDLVKKPGDSLVFESIHCGPRYFAVWRNQLYCWVGITGQRMAEGSEFRNECIPLRTTKTERRRIPCPMLTWRKEGARIHLPRWKVIMFQVFVSGIHFDVAPTSGREVSLFFNSLVILPLQCVGHHGISSLGDEAMALCTCLEPLF